MHGHKVVLITGGCGAIGAVVVNWLKKEYPTTLFVNLDALTYCGKKEHIEPPLHNYKFYYGSITDASLVSYILETEQPTLLIHLAAETHVDQSFGNSFRFTHVNVMGTHTLLECAKGYGKLRMFLHMSTDEVYGSVCNKETCTETSMFAPSNPYSASKAAGEMICHAYQKSFALPITIMRCNNAISPFQHEEKLIPRCVETIIQREKLAGAKVEDNLPKIPIHGSGMSKRTFIHAADIATAIDTIVAKGKDGSIYNIGTGAHMEHTVMDVVRTVVKLMVPTIDASDDDNINNYIEHVPDRAFQDYRYSIDSSALRSLGWTDKISFDHAIEDIIEHRRHIRA